MPTFEVAPGTDVPAGIIIPPKDIRDIVEKTATYVSRNGLQFEDKIREKEQYNVKFSFLNPADHYFKFYQYRLDELKSGKPSTTNVTVPKLSTPNFAPTLESGIDTHQPYGFQAQQQQQKPFGQAPPFEFSAPLPAISPQDLDVLKLTAQFVARNGRQFMTSLSQRESRNYQFDFLRPNHSLYTFFTKLVEQYTKVLIPPKDMESKLKKNVENKLSVLDRVKVRVSWQRKAEEERKRQADKEDKEKSTSLLSLETLLIFLLVLYAQIDWHDFIVVEMVEFTEVDNHMDLPPPTNLVDLQHATLEQKRMMSLFPQPGQLMIDNTSSAITPQYTPQPIPSVQPQPLRQQQQRVEPLLPVLQTTVPIAVSDYDMAPPPALQQPGNLGNMKIRQTYTPRGPTSAKQTSVCPRCNQPIPVGELEEHMRIELLDPKWRDQKAKEEARKASTNLQPEGVAHNIKRLASARADIFESGSSGGGPEKKAKIETGPKRK
ncbi:Pre-mRNA-splicing factor sap114 [Neolecta irregularis DAH-3]|uniref:Pre-mRNA-splicing factor sap114 n=1 Tax=Neolecta irregularis (strain DAH-3) TaxID=1198029 RepID=A0A1U7LGH3_NEOID|nr:Pre-mRNA-splicing factor sap114 [Neolecta irregularis DAH-3]|eukprot:OLL21755.1 Pre-mRNA-splicing factor sap114 [Neolecta irregularis DAH-3]